MNFLQASAAQVKTFTCHINGRMKSPALVRMGKSQGINAMKMSFVVQQDKLLVGEETILRRNGHLQNMLRI